MRALGCYCQNLAWERAYYTVHSNQTGLLRECIKTAFAIPQEANCPLLHICDAFLCTIVYPVVIIFAC